MFVSNNYLTPPTFCTRPFIFFGVDFVFLECGGDKLCIQSLLGRGGYSEVYRARGAGVTVAAKFTRVFHDSGACQARWEAAIMYQIRHAYIMCLLHVVYTPASVTIAMRYMSGGDLVESMAIVARRFSVCSKMDEADGRCRPISPFDGHCSPGSQTRQHPA
jgi:hypothetical protein